MTNLNTKAYIQGREASGLGYGRDRNPYSTSSGQWLAWDMGWANGVEEDEENDGVEEDEENAYDELLDRISGLDREQKKEIADMINEGFL